MKEKLVNAIADMQEEEAIRLAGEMLDAGIDPQVVLDASREAMTIVGNRYEKKEYFLPELIIAGDLLKEIGAPGETPAESGIRREQTLGKVLIGTVAGDIHDIGKDVVGFMLDVNNFEVQDIGVDVPAETVRREGPGVQAARRGHERLPDAGLRPDEAHRQGRLAGRQGCAAG